METHFQKLDVFRDILRHYHPSEKVVETLQKTPFVALVGPTASGRDTIIKELAKTNRYYAVVTDTTRPPRTNNGIVEQNGVEYFFRNEDDMLAELRDGRFLEAAIIHKHYVYGVSVREIEKAWAENKIAITDIEVVGTDTIKRLKPDTIAIFVLPPSLDTWFARIKKRNPTITDEEFNRRLASAHNEFKVAQQRDYYSFIVNDHLQEAAAWVDAIATSKNNPIYDAGNTQAKVLLQTLITELGQYIDTYAS